VPWGLISESILMRSAGFWFVISGLWVLYVTKKTRVICRGQWSDPKTLFMICDFDTQTVWPSTLMYTNGLACNFYAQTVWPPTKPVTQLGEVGCKIDFAKKMKTTMVGSFARSIGMTIANTNKYSWEHHRKGLVEGAVDGLYGLENQLRKKLSITLIYFILFFTIFSTRSPRNRSDRTPLTSPSGRASFPTPLPSCTRFLSWLLCVSRRQSPLKKTTYCI